MLYLHQVESLRVYATQFYIRSKYYKVTLVAISFFWVVCLSILLLSLFRAKTIFEMSKSPFREEASSTTLLCPRMVVRQIGKDPIFCSIKNQIRFDCNLFASDQSKNSCIALQYNLAKIKMAKGVDIFGNSRAIFDKIWRLFQKMPVQIQKPSVLCNVVN